jgi:putative transport protein
MREFLQHHPLLVLFGVAALGTLIAKLRIRGFSLGVAAVLFAGLLLGAVSPGIELPEFVPQLGLVLFVYTLGLSSGHGFFAALGLRGFKDNALALGVLAVCFALTLVLARAFGLGGPHAAGLFAGALTNTPALAGAVDALKATGANAATLADPVIAYALCYPTGVLIPLLAVWLGERLSGKSYKEASTTSDDSSLSESIISVTVLVDVALRMPARLLRKTADWSVTFGRIRRGSETKVVEDDTLFEPGDLVTLIGKQRDIVAATKALGRVSTDHIELERSEIDYRRLIASNPELAGRTLRELNLTERHGAVITRIRRGDLEFVPDSTFSLELGDRVRVLAPRARIRELERLFGDSLRQVSEVDVITFSLGIALGLLLSLVPFPAPGIGHFQLGIAGGPLIAGLVLGRIGRSGPLVWTLPYGANLTLRQLGLVLFLAGVGLRAGGSLAGTPDALGLLPQLVTGVLVTITSAALALVVGHKLLRIPLGIMIGILGGIQTQPAVLAFAIEKTGNDQPNLGYTSVFPMSMIAKIILAQALLQFAQ